MSDTIGELQRRIRRRFESIPSAQYEQIAGDFQKLIDNGLRSGHDLSKMALDPSLDPSIRSIACWFMARLMPKRVSVSTLMTLMAESPTLVRVEAIRSLGVTRSNRALTAVIDLALHDSVAMVRESSVDALGLLQDERGLDALLTIAQNEDESPALRGLAIEQVGRLGVARSDVIQVLTSLLEQERVEVAFWAVHALVVHPPSSCSSWNLCDARPDAVVCGVDDVPRRRGSDGHSSRPWRRRRRSQSRPRSRSSGPSGPASAGPSTRARSGSGRPRRSVGRRTPNAGGPRENSSTSLARWMFTLSSMA